MYDDPRLHMRRRVDRTDMTLASRDWPAAISRILRPAVVENVDSPRLTSDGRTTSATRGLPSQVRRFVAIGVVSTLAWAGLFTTLRALGLGSVAANGLA